MKAARQNYINIHPNSPDIMELYEFSSQSEVHETKYSINLRIRNPRASNHALIIQYFCCYWCEK